MTRLVALILALVACAVAVPLIAQENADEEKDFFLRFVEEQLSAPGRQIAVSGIDGVLSSDVSIPEITVSDGEGVYLRIENAILNWDQGALLTGRLQINRLSADTIDYIRPARPAKGVDLPAPEAQAFEIPQFPIAIALDELSVPSVIFGDQVFGLGSEIAVEGRLSLENGSLDTRLDITRKDGPGGTLALALKYDRDSENADIDLTLAEPPNGLIVNLFNMEGKPDLNVNLKGSGPLSSLKTDMTLDAGGKRALTGVARLERVEVGLRVDVGLCGPLADLVPAAYKSFFGVETSIVATALLRDEGGVKIDSLVLKGGALSLKASAETTTDGFLTNLKLDAAIASSDGAKVLLPGGGAKTGIDKARLTIDYGTGDIWTAALAVDGLKTPEVSAQNLSLDISGAASNLDDPLSRRITFNADGNIAGISSNNPQLTEALGSEMGLGIAGLWSPTEALKIAEARLRGKAFDMALSGVVDKFVFDGDLALATPLIASFSGFAGRQLGGALNLDASGTLSLLSGGFDLRLDGKADDLALGVKPLDNLLTGRTNLSGRLARTEGGVIADGFEIGNARSKITADGSFASDKADFKFTVGVTDLSHISESATGALTAVGAAKGTNGTIVLAFEASVPAGSLSNHRLTEAKLGFGGTLEDGALAGNLKGAAFLDGHRVDLTAALASENGVGRLGGLAFKTLGTTLTGDILQNADGLLSGTLDLNSTDLSLAAALLMTDARGAATASIELDPVDGKQTARIAMQARGLVLNKTTTVGSATIKASMGDLFGVPAIEGTIDGTDVTAGGLTIDTLSATANRHGDTTAFTAAAALDNGSRLEAGGSLAPKGEGYRLVLDRARLDRGALSAKLVGSTSATIADDVVILESVKLEVGGGRITSSGTAGETLDLTIDMADVPLAVVNALMPELGLAGVIEGRLYLTGKTADAKIAFEISGRGIETAASVGYGITPLSMKASGSFANDTISLASLSAVGTAGAVIAASGTLAMIGSGSDLVISGKIPLSIANTMVGSRGTQFSGTVALAARVTGSLAKPSYGGTISTADAEIVDPLSNLRLQAIAATARFSTEQIMLEHFGGALATGGSVGVSGTVSLKAEAGFPAALQIVLNSARYADGNLFVATASGQLALSGALLRDPLVSGDVRLEHAEISIPDSFDNGEAQLNVDHRATPPGVATTLKRIESNTTGATGSESSSDLQLNVSITAPNQVFVRGRGVDAELGGQVRLTGPVSAIRPVGGFELIRGRLTILGQRIEFDSGTVSLIGDLDPYIDLTASSPGDSITVYVTVRGPVSDLDIAFSSTPELPQDEVLSQLIFRRTLGDLSPLQLARLAAAASELAGGGSNSLTNSLRSAAGLADLNVVSDSEGNTAVRAGTYLQDNVYVSVEAGTQGKNKVSIDLDLTDTIKASGSTTNDGETSIGLYYEQDF